MWKRIVNIVRPNGNNHQDRIITKAHKKAELMENKVEVKEDAQVYGQFKSFFDQVIEFKYVAKLQGVTP
ncbi:hypothetical protein NQ317_008085 [Molorchus minor]|uniref:Uncharacterized protein n=1 Tax=Molorchus minor TaxID=1323400 RepID=A0ABQ9IPQ9_9CUCU|nr:hypothetical protein NQ317_008085 [Molorchus minor]